MKKILTLAAVLVAALAMNAAVIYDWANGVGSTTIKRESGETAVVDNATVTINSVETNAIKFSKGYSSKVTVDGNETYQYNYIIIKPASGGFKAGDVLKFKGVVSHDGSDAAKVASFRVRVTDDKSLWDSDNVVNAGVDNNEPTEMTYTLEADAEELHAGRQGKTTLYLVSLVVERTATNIDNTAVEGKVVKTFENGQLVVIKNGVKYNATGSVIR